MSCKPSNPDFSHARARSIFWKVFLFAFIIQLVRNSIFLTDHGMWASQLRFFLTNDPRQFNFFAGYGHPGTTLISLGSVFHVLFGVSYSNALTLSLTVIISGATAACAVLCYVLQPQSLWWFTTAFILTLSRFYVKATPPTATVTALTVLVALASCWLWKQDGKVSLWLYFLWGVLLGLSFSTRFDVTILVGAPLLLLLTLRTGARVIGPVLSGGLMGFFVSDPYLWFMPLQHIKDLIHNLLIHSSRNAGSYGRLSISWLEWAHGTFLAAISIALFVYLQARRRLKNSVPPQVLLVLLGCTLVTLTLLIISKVQAMRYMYPLIMSWEVFLPLFALQDCPQTYGDISFKSGRLDPKTATVIMGFIIPTQILGYCLIFFG
ncbi:MAG TPA: hypothetical protein VI389_10980 [Geobacteraceae bacterium]